MICLRRLAAPAPFSAATLCSALNTPRTVSGAGACSIRCAARPRPPAQLLFYAPANMLGTPHGSATYWVGSEDQRDAADTPQWIAAPSYALDIHKRISPMSPMTRPPRPQTRTHLRVPAPLGRVAEVAGGAVQRGQPLARDAGRLAHRARHRRLAHAQLQALVVRRDLAQHQVRGRQQVACARVRQTPAPLTARSSQWAAHMVADLQRSCKSASLLSCD